MSTHVKDAAKEVGTIAVGAGVASAGVNVAQNVLPQTIAHLGVQNATRGALGLLSSAIFPGAGLLTALSGLKMMTAPLFQPWTTPGGK